MFSISYILEEHGWARALITDGQTVIETDVSYLSDALGDLARGARGILRGLSEVTFSFQQEPGEHRFVVSREANRVRVTVYQFAATFSRAKQGQMLLSVECSLGEFATACINCVRHVLDQHGTAGYLARWKNHEFPLQAYHDLLQLRRELPSAPR